MPQHELDEMLPGAGDALGPYELVTPVGAGGMARVWVARVRATGQLVAVKTLLPQLAENVSFQEMFLDEAHIAGRIAHPNVCATFDLGQHDKTLYLAMEWIDGPSLMRVLRPHGDAHSDNDGAPRIPIKPRLAARIVADTCAGLHAAHELVAEDGRPLAVVHRDVSPHNVLLTSTGLIKVTDFGVAKAIGKSHMTVAGQLKGKLAYMAPEQLMGGGIDRRADVFALGCVLYEITTGQRPFVGEHDPQVMAQIMIGNYELPTSVIADYPKELEAIVVKALANEPENRFQSAEQMRKALEGWLRTSGPPVMPPQVAALIRERCGAELDARARMLATSGVGPASGTTPARSDTHRVPEPRPSGRISDNGAALDRGRRSRPTEDQPTSRGVLWFVVAAFIGASLGLGVLVLARSMRKAKRLAAASAIELDASSPSSPSSRAMPFGAQTAPNGIVLPVMASAVPAEPIRSRPAAVRLHVQPETALLVVDGVVLPRGTDTIARPSDGGASTVLVRSENHEDTIVVVDSATPDDVEVALLPRTHQDGKVDNKPGEKAAERPSVIKPKSNENGTSGGAADPTTEAPPNPYD
ncbi:serine/threonine protein kinase [Labilithrix luteola]|nr:serine/threonine-protein kinase [Labilithrix luteola]